VIPHPATEANEAALTDARSTSDHASRTDVLMADPAFEAVPSPAQVQRLQKSAVAEALRERAHTVVLPPVFWVYEPGDVGKWTSSRNGYVDKQFRINAATDQANLDTGFSMAEVDPSDFSWDYSF
jgi:Putative phage tail protein